jgi:uncharacterized LabA/DUF88 family protein
MKVGIYIDAYNISLNGGYAMRYDILRDFCVQGDTGLRLNTYMVFDEERAEEDIEYRDRQYGYFSVLRSFGYKVIIKPVRRYKNENGDWVTKGNIDIDMATDMLIQSSNLDRLVVLSGDGDFAKAVQAIQNRGVRVELIAFRNISRDLINECDNFTSGFLIPNLLPTSNTEQDPLEWGKQDCKVRGVCYNIDEGYGFLRYLDLEYHPREIFFHFSQLPKGYHVRMDDIFEFTIVPNLKKDGLMAVDMIPVR